MITNFYEYKAEVIEVYDGDTITVVLDLGFKIKHETKIRLAGINAPEVRGEEREQGLITRDYLRRLILNKEVIIKTQKDKKGKYGRYIGTVFIGGKNVNTLLVEQELAEEVTY